MGLWQGRNVESLGLPSPSPWSLLWPQFWACVSVSYYHNNAMKQTIPKLRGFQQGAVALTFVGLLVDHCSPELGRAQRGTLSQTSGWAQVHRSPFSEPH